MAMTAKKEYLNNLEEQTMEVRNLVLDGVKQIQDNNVNDFDLVCDRLEKKYNNAAVQD